MREFTCLRKLARMLPFLASAVRMSGPWGLLGVVLLGSVSVAGGSGPVDRTGLWPLAPADAIPVEEDILGRLRLQPPGVEFAAAGSGGVWVAQGPAPILHSLFLVEKVIPDNEVAGAVHAVAAHPTDPDILWVGTVNGGIWRTKNATDEHPSWEPLTDDQPGLSIGALDLDPTSSTVLLAGMGRRSSFSSTGDTLTGLLRSTDGGDTWTAINPPALVGQNISGVAVRGTWFLVSSRNSSGGIFRSTNVGGTWTQISGASGTGLPAGTVFDLAGDPSAVQRFYASVKGDGVYRTDDMGANWVNVSQNDNTLNQAITQPGNNNTKMAVSSDGTLVYVGVIRKGGLEYIGYSDDQGDHWKKMDLPLLLAQWGTVTDASNANPIVITCLGNHNLRENERVIIRNVLGNTAANGFWRVKLVDDVRFELQGSDGNGDWIANPFATWTNVDGIHNPKKDTYGQGAKHFSIAVDPSDPHIVYVGGQVQDVPQLPPFPGIGAVVIPSGNLWRGNSRLAPLPSDEDLPPSPQWKHLTHFWQQGPPGGGTVNGTAPHGDSRDMTFDANGDMIEVDDGGIYRRTSPLDNHGPPGGPSADWYSVNGNLQITEFHSIAYDSNSNIIFGGAQDVATSYQPFPGAKKWWSLIEGGDGGVVAVDDSSTPGFSTRYTSSQKVMFLKRITYDQNNLPTAGSILSLTDTSGGDGIKAQMYTPIRLNAVDAKRLLLGGTNAVWESMDQGDNITRIGGGGAESKALVYGHPSNEDVVYAGAGGDVFVRTARGGDLVVTPTAFPGGGVRDIVLDPADVNVAYVIDSNQVFQTTDRGTTWTDITSNLGSTGADGFRALEYIEGPSNDIVVVGTDAGVYASRAPGFTCWFEFGGGLPNVLIGDLDYDPADDLLVAGTLGRGAWSLESASTQGGGAITIPGDVFFDATCPDETRTETLHVCNTGDGILEVEGISSADPLLFDVTEPSSGYPVAIGPGFCFPFQVVFHASGSGLMTATLTIQNTDPCYPTVEVQATGEALSSRLEVDRALDFGTVCGPEEIEFRLSNLGECGLSVTDVDFEDPCPEFSLVSGPSAPFSLGPGSHVDYRVRYEPQDGGADSCTLAVASEVGGFSRDLTGQRGEPNLEVDGALDFGLVCDQQDLELKVFNTGDCDLDVTDLIFVDPCPEFSVASGPDLPVTVSPGTHVSYTLRYQPTDVGSDSCNLEVRSGSGSKKPLLRGEGGGANLEVNGSLDFGVVCDRSERQLEIFNTGDCDLDLTDLEFLGPCSEFSLVSGPDLPAIVGPDAHINYTLRYEPADPGSDSCTLQVLSGSGAEVSELRGERGEPNLEVNGSLDFGLVCDRGEQQLEIFNTGECDLQLTDLEFLDPCPDFDILSGPSLPTTVAPGAHVDYSVRYEPSDRGEDSCRLSIESDGGRIVEEATGERGDPNIEVNGALDFGMVCEQADRQLEIFNTGKCDLTVSAVGFLGSCPEFEIVSGPNLPVVANPDSHLNFTVRYVPAGPGPSSCTLRIESDDPDTGALDLLVTGEGGAPDALVSGSLNFGGLPVDDRTEPHAGVRTFSIYNNGSCSLEISDVSRGAGSADYTVLTPPGFPLTLMPGSHIDVGVGYNPAAAGASMATIAVSTDDPDMPALDLLAVGKGLIPDIDADGLAAGGLKFGPTVVDFGCASEDGVTIQNLGQAELIVTDVRSTHPDFHVVALTPPIRIAPNGAFEVRVVFEPSVTARRISGALEITSNDPLLPVLSVPLCGEGVDTGIRLLVTDPTGTPVPLVTRLQLDSSGVSGSVQDKRTNLAPVVLGPPDTCGSQAFHYEAYLTPTETVGNQGSYYTLRVTLKDKGRPETRRVSFTLDVCEFKELLLKGD